MKTETVTVTVRYDGSTPPKADPAVVGVVPGDAIQFVFERGAVNGKMRVTFPEKQFFGTDNPLFAGSGIFHEGDGLVRVGELPYRTTYVCQMLDENDVVIASSDDKGGGAVEPVKR
jgi:hypothetical protein